MKRQSALKIHGGKNYLADWIVSLMPPRCKNPNKPEAGDDGWLHYVEPYAGGLAVLFALDPEGISEVVCDVSRGLTAFWRTMQSEKRFAEFCRAIDAMPFSENEWIKATHVVNANETTVEKAVRFFVKCRQSMSGRMDSFAPLTRNRTRRGMNEQVSAWLSAVEGLPEIHARMQRVAVLSGPALRVIRQQDDSRTLFYCDPPYHPSTRTAKEVYEHEMSHRDHFELLDLLSEIEGRFLLSGYRCEIYDAFADKYGWRREEMPIDNKSGKGKKKQQRTECVLMNY